MTSHQAAGYESFAGLQAICAGGGDAAARRFQDNVEYGRSGEQGVVVIAPDHLAKIGVLDLAMATSLSAAAQLLAQERRVANFLEKMFAMEHMWGASSPRVKAGYWADPTPRRHTSMIQTPLESDHRLQ